MSRCWELILGALFPCATSTANKYASSEWDSNRRNFIPVIQYYVHQITRALVSKIPLWSTYSSKQFFFFFQIFSVFGQEEIQWHTHEVYFRSLEEQNQTYFFTRFIIVFHPLSRSLLLFGCFKYLTIQRVLNIYTTASVCPKVAPFFTSYLQVRQRERFLSNRRQSPDG